MDKQSFSKLSKLAESGDTKALFKLGKMCLVGRYVNDLYIPQDKVKGFRLIQQAAALGYTQAQSYLGRVHIFRQLIESSNNFYCLTFLKPLKNQLVACIL